MAALSQQLEIWGYDNGFTLFSDGTLGFGLELVPIDVSCWVDAELDQLASQIETVLNSLPPGVTIQFILETKRGGSEIIDAHNNLLKGDISDCVVEIHKSRITELREKANQGLIPLRTLKVFARTPSRTLLTKRSFFSKPSKVEQLSEEHIKNERGVAERLRNDLLRLLASLQLEPRQLSNEEVSDITYRQWNTGRPIGLKGYNPENVRSSLLFSDVAIHKEGFSIGPVEHRVISLLNLPNHTYSAMFSHFGMMPFDSHIVLTFEVCDQQKEIERLQLQRRLAFSMARGKRTGVSDIESEAKFNDLEQMISDLVASGQKVFNMSFNVVLRSRSESELNDQVAYVLQSIQELGASPKNR